MCNKAYRVENLHYREVANWFLQFCSNGELMVTTDYDDDTNYEAGSTTNETFSLTREDAQEAILMLSMFVAQCDEIEECKACGGEELHYAKTCQSCKTKTIRSQKSEQLSDAAINPKGE